MESLLVRDVDVAVQFLCSTIPGCYIERTPSPSPSTPRKEQDASAAAVTVAVAVGIYAIVRLESTNAAQDVPSRRIMVHNAAASKLLRNSRLCVAVVDVGFLLQSLEQYPGVQLARPLEGSPAGEQITDVFENDPQGCFIIGPGGVEVICVKASDSAEVEDSPCLSLLDIEAFSSYSSAPSSRAVSSDVNAAAVVGPLGRTASRSQSQDGSTPRGLAPGLGLGPGGIGGGLGAGAGASAGAAMGSSVSGAGGPDPSPRGTRYPRLFPFLLDGASMRPIDCNTSLPVPFKTDLFEGCAVLVVNASLDPAVVVDTTKLTFEVQVQGKFLRKPKGMMYIGAEISKKMELGMFTRSLCRTIMNFARSKLPSLHHSFGDDNNTEWPHITGPLWSMSDLMIVTRPGETPPPLGKGALPESAESRRARRTNPSLAVDVDLDCTYSFSTNTCNLDIVNWEVCNIPLLSTLDLHTFWTDADLMLCAYELEPPPPSSSSSSSTATTDMDVHDRARIHYCFRLLLKHGSNHPELTHPGQTSASGTTTAPSLRSLMRQSVAKNNSAAEDEGNLFFDEQDEFYDAFADEDQVNAVRQDDQYYSSSTTATSSIALDSSPFVGRLSSVTLSTENFTFVPVVFEVDDDRKLSITNAGARRVYYGVKFPGVFNVPGRSAFARLDSNLCLKSYKECTNALSHIKWTFKKPMNFARLDESEQRRAELQALFRFIFDSEISKTTSSTTNRALFSLFSDREATGGLLDDSKGMDFGVADRKRRDDIVEYQFGSRVCLQLGRFYWSENYLVLSGTELVFIQPSSKLGKSARLQVHLGDIIEVAAVPESEYPIAGISKSFFFFRVSTFARQYNIMVRGEQNRNEWMARLSQRYPSSPAAVESRLASLGSIEIGNNSSGSFSLTSLAMLSEPRGFNLGPTVVLNGRQIQANPSSVNITMADVVKGGSASMRDSMIIFGAAGVPSDPLTAKTALSAKESLVRPPNITDDRHVVSVEFAAKIVAEALNQVLVIAALSSTNSGRDATATTTTMTGPRRIELLRRWVEFMDTVSALANMRFDMSSFDPKGSAEIALFLNLYHTMVLHAFLVVRVPLSMQDWPNVFSGCSYEAFGDIFSIAELEHGVLRGGMSKPQVFIASLLISKPQFEFSLTCRDLRLLWALNCASYSLMDSVPVYSAARLGHQLDRNLSLSLERQCVFTNSSVRLPVLCQWFRKDITQGGRDSIHGILSALLPYMSPTQATAAAELIRFNSARLTVMYTPLNFRCRFLKLQSS